MADAEPAAQDKTLTEEDLKTKTTVYVKNSDFPADFDEDKLTELFKDCGAIVSTTLLRKPATKELRGTGFVQFETHEAAAKAVKEYNNKLVGNGRLGVVFSTSSGPKEPKPQKEVAEGPTLFIRSLNYKVKNKMLKKEFVSFGKVKSCRVNRKGYAFIEFDTVEEAKKAKEEMNGKELEGKAIEIFYAEQREKPEKKKTEKKEKDDQATPEKKANKRRRNKKRGKQNQKKDEAKEEGGEEAKEERKPKGRRRLLLKCMVEEGKPKASEDITEEDVRAFLAQFGAVSKCKVKQKEVGTFAYIGFEEAEGAAKAVEAKEGVIKGATFDISFSRNTRRPGRGRKQGGATQV